eukprot:SAG22_NODE_4430_length_1272_cov_0.953112_2_plen_51_part_00
MVKTEMEIEVKADDGDVAATQANVVAPWQPQSQPQPQPPQPGGGEDDDWL